MHTNRTAWIAYGALAASAIGVVAFIGLSGFAAWNVVPHLVFAGLLRVVDERRAMAIAAVVTSVVVAAAMFFFAGCARGPFCAPDGQSGLLLIFIPVWALVGGAVLFGAVAAVIAFRRRT